MIRHHCRAALAASILASCLALTAGVATAASSTLSRPLLRSGEMPGMRVQGPRTHLRTVRAYTRTIRAHGARATKIRRRLRGAGFAGGLSESLTGRHGRRGLSNVFRFTHRGGSRVGRGVLFGQAKRGVRTAPVRHTFAVPGVRSARGIAATGPHLSVTDVYWTEGGCVLGAAQSVPGGDRLSFRQIERPLITAVHAVIRRSHGHCSVRG